MPRVREPQGTPPLSARNERIADFEPKVVTPVAPTAPRRSCVTPSLTPRSPGGPLQDDWKSELLALVKQQQHAFEKHLHLRQDGLLRAIEDLLGRAVGDSKGDDAAANSECDSVFGENQAQVRQVSNGKSAAYESSISGNERKESALRRLSWECQEASDTMSGKALGEKLDRKSEKQKPSSRFSVHSTISGKVLGEMTNNIDHEGTKSEDEARNPVKDFLLKKLEFLRIKTGLDASQEQVVQLKDQMHKDIAAGEGLFYRRVGTHFDFWIGVLILLNTVVLMIQLQWQGYQAAVDLGFQRDDDGWAGAETAFFVVEHCFNGIFLLELIIRAYYYRLGFFLDFTNIFDLGLVLISSVDLYILAPMKSSLGGNISFLRIIRLAKIMRVLRLVRVLTLFRNLRILVSTIVASAQALMWSMVLLTFIIVMSGIFMCQILEKHIQDKAVDTKDREWAYLFYGSASRSVYTMFEATLSGCWPTYSRPLVENVSPWYAVFFAIYISGVVFAVVRIITALFLRETLLVASSDADMIVQEKAMQKNQYIQKLKLFFKEADTSGDGVIDFEEFTSIMANPKVKAWMSSLELEVHESHALFQLLDDGDGQITYDEFLKGVIRLKGQARSIDVVCIMHDMTRLSKRVEALIQVVDDAFRGSTGF